MRIGLRQLHPTLLIHHEEVDSGKIENWTNLDDYIPIAVTPIGNKYLILDGHHRAFSCELLGKLIPCLIFENYFSSDIEVRSGICYGNTVRHKITKEEVVLRAMIGQLFKPKSTRHYYKRKHIIEECKKWKEKS